jgi:electron transfer flavoprotein beta subunit
LDLASLNTGANVKTKVVAMELPAEKPAVKMLSGDAAAQATALVKALRDEAKVL